MWKDNIYRGFLIFFESLTFGVNSGVKQYKMAQNDKKLCLFYSIYHEAYIIWSWILVHMCEMMTSLFSRFWYLIFWTVRRGEVKGQKMAQNDNITKNSVCLTLYLRSCTSYDCGFWYTYFERLYLQQYFHFFQNSVFLWVLGGKRAKHDWYFSILVCHILYLQNCRSCHQDHWCTVIK